MWETKKNVPTRSKITGITILVGIFGPQNIGNTRYTHTSTQNIQLLPAKMESSRNYSLKIIKNNLFNPLASILSNTIAMIQLNKK